MSNSIDKLVHKSQQEELLFSLAWAVVREINEQLRTLSANEAHEYYTKLYPHDEDKATKKYNDWLERQRR